MNFELITYTLENNSAFFYTLILVLGLVIGSFLNVVIHRVPIMMEHQWASEAKYIVSLLEKGQSLIKPNHSVEGSSDDDATELSPETTTPPFNLVLPHSHCPHCKTNIKPSDNIPLLSYLVLKGRCRHCQQSISMRYPLVEAVTGLLSLCVALHFGFSWATFGALILTWCLITLTLIDFDTQLLPDQIVFSLLWIGLIFNLFSTYALLFDAVIGAVVGYLVLWSIFWLFKLLTGKEGMGYGDFKLLAALGAWMGYQAILPIVLLSSFAGAAIGIGMIVLKGRDKQTPMAFGPYLAIGGWLTLFFQEALLEFIL